MRNISLDFYRGLFAIVVAIGHYFYWQNQYDIFPVSFVLAVDFFFILSGYVLTYPLLTSSLNANQYTIYLIKTRIFRLFPLYLFLVIPLTFISWLFIQKVSPNGLDWLKIIGLLQVFPFNTNTSFDYPLDISWSISSEFWIGIVYFPILFYIRKHIIAIPILILLSIFILLLININSPNFMNVHYELYNSYISYANLRCLLGLMLGSTIAYLKYYRGIQQYSSLSQSIIQLLSIGVIIFLYGYIDYDRNNEFIAPFIFSLFIWSLSTEKGILYSVANNKFGAFLGKISYPLYLSHPIIIKSITYGIIKQNIIIYLIISIGISYILHLLIEKPFIIIGKKLSPTTVSKNV